MIITVSEMVFEEQLDSTRAHLSVPMSDQALDETSHIAPVDAGSPGDLVKTPEAVIPLVMNRPGSGEMSEPESEWAQF